VTSLEAHGVGATAVAVTPDGMRAVSAAEDGKLKVWDLETCKLVTALDVGVEWVTAVALSSNGTVAVTGVKGGQLKVWDLERSREVAMFDGHTATVRYVAITSDGRRVVSGAEDGCLKVWVLSAPGPQVTMEGDAPGIFKVLTTPARARAVSGSAEVDGNINVWDLESDPHQTTFVRPDWKWAVPLKVDGSLALTAAGLHTVIVKESASGASIATFVVDAEMSAIAGAGDRFIVVGCENGSVHFLELVE